MYLSDTLPSIKYFISTEYFKRSFDIINTKGISDMTIRKPVLFLIYLFCLFGFVVVCVCFSLQFLVKPNHV